MAQKLQVPSESPAPLTQLATHTLFWLLVCEHPASSAVELQDEQAVHVVVSGR